LCCLNDVLFFQCVKIIMCIYNYFINPFKLWINFINIKLQIYNNVFLNIHLSIQSLNIGIWKVIMVYIICPFQLEK
jgi:hypothetical protein